MLGIRSFNKNRGHEVPIVHGATTDGKTWRFLRLEGTNLYIDKTEFSSRDLPSLLGALQEIIDFYKPKAP